MTEFQPEDKKRILNRLRRARGQLNAVIEAAESGAPCRDVVTQLAALSSALDRAGYAIISGAMKGCIRDGDSREDGDLTPEELEKLFLMLA
ncbi:metal-sensitive transcriptional regulator [Corynebacterium sp. CCM 8835]|uniref:Metal-sensitive transcriptional regulator n=1 Tax=Corynebacterium antarcticum TaxID=2800405 RepID=A0A9Q4CCU4_9CORY|nr:metal-sensitive transcriptional regulator [Corynebacterium antarcticum]MCK7642868.1 metal-sensitive transcriptional regulator [Corynebacterium antarcticum]MCK7661371.1 metal-sensitive transcriptional regulator [Corynebacterium antarcticum]MCL0246108.1 metal-sensitive transcriptional regulator [Corynebacterium antarcticum]MCX7492357.1 metal-sensitive transcriptional regulator [Corynebacterium antarcticum]MCX7538529.1 metal-sensitive transcriptional regulator [Corynebacterium antarcticum]